MWPPSAAPALRTGRNPGEGGICPGPERERSISSPDRGPGPRGSFCWVLFGEAVLPASSPSFSPLLRLPGSGSEGLLPVCRPFILSSPVSTAISGYLAQSHPAGRAGSRP